MKAIEQCFVFPVVLFAMQYNVLVPFADEIQNCYHSNLGDFVQTRKKLNYRTQGLISGRIKYVSRPVRTWSPYTMKPPLRGHLGTRRNVPFMEVWSHFSLLHINDFSTITKLVIKTITE